MMKEAVATGATVEEARMAAIQELGDLGSESDNIQFEIIDLPQKKTLGLFGGCPAKVRVFVDLPEHKEPIKTVEKYQRLDKEKKTSETAKSSHVEVTKKVGAEPSAAEPPVPTALAPFTDDIKKSVAEKGMHYLKTILDHMDIEADLKSGETESGAIIMLEGKNLGAIVGRRGETLDALQYLTVLAANHDIDGYYRITLNTGNYREKREKTLQALARRMANQSLKTGRNISLEPMNPFERRIIHTAIQDVRGVTFWSVGEEPFRKVIIGTGKDNRNYRGGRGGYRKDGGNRRNEERSFSSSAPEREQKKDFDIAPLYGKIEK